MEPGTTVAGAFTRSKSRSAPVDWCVDSLDGGTARAVAQTLQGYYASLREHQTTAPWRERMLDFDGLNRLLGTPELLESARRYDA